MVATARWSQPPTTLRKSLLSLGAQPATLPGPQRMLLVGAGPLCGPRAP